MTEQIIRELALFLDPYKTTVLEEYQNNIYQDCPILTENDRLRINDANDRHIYEGQLLLKEIVSERVEGAVDNIELNSWIVRIWGGINRFNPNLRYGADNRVSLFFNALNNRNIPNRFIKSISSLSKIASFIKPDDYFVYDSRVSVALNGLLLKYLEYHNDAAVSFFYMPNARNRRDVIMNTIINERVNNVDFYPVNDVYFEFCDVVKKLNRILYLTDEEPGKVEMLLFMLARTGSVIEDWFNMQELRANMDNSSKSEKISTSNSQEASPSNISTGDWIDIETYYSHTPNGNGRQLVFINKKFKDTITEHYNEGEALEIQVENKIVKVKSKNPYKYASFRQREINNWAKQKENEGTIQNGQTFTIKARFIYNENN